MTKLLMLRFKPQWKKKRKLPKVFLVTVLTSLDDLDLRRLGYRQTSTLELAKERAGRALQFGLDGVICSGREAAEIRDIAAHCPDFIIATPGLRPDGDSRHDQKRVATPTEAIRSGADYLIVGRPVIHASDPAEAADKIINEMQHAFDSRYRCQ